MTIDSLVSFVAMSFLSEWCHDGISVSPIEAYRGAAFILVVVPCGRAVRCLHLRMHAPEAR